MAQYHVKNTSHLDKAFKVRGGFDVVATGASVDVLDAVDLTDEQITALSVDGVHVKAFEGQVNADGTEDRDANGDTPEMAQLRQQFDTSYKRQTDELTVSDGKVVNLNTRVTELDGLVKAKDDEIVQLKAKIVELQEAAEASPQLKSAAEVLAMATAPGVHFKTFEAEAKKLLGDKTPSGKDEIVKALEELATKP